MRKIMSTAKIASETKLPPSPEIHNNDNNHHGLSSADSLLHGTFLSPPAAAHWEDDAPSNASRPKQRLRSIAKYQSFHPQALACSPPLHVSSENHHHSSTYSSNTTSGGQQRNHHPQHQPQQQQWTSLGAVAGCDGVALFRISKPQIPLLLLSYASNTQIPTSLSFQPLVTQKTLFLASARGSGVLVWDVEHSLSPLWGRLHTDEEQQPQSSSSSSSSSNIITSLSWTRSHNNMLLAATNPSSACLWDLRQSAFRPSLRFMTASSAETPPLLQIACGATTECAILDAAGTVRIFDARMSQRKSSATGSGSIGCLAQLNAYQHAGIGISYFQEHVWLTWGMDTPEDGAIVKVWSSAPEDSAKMTPGGGLGGDDYWYMDGSADGRNKYDYQNPNTTMATASTDYKVIARCTTQNLACARVCPSPIDDCFVTIGFNNSAAAASVATRGWRAQLWKLQQRNSSTTATDPLQKVLSFEGGSETAALQSITGKDPRLQSLRAAELAVSTYPASATHLEGLRSTESGLLLCCLTENGYITTHAIPEANPRHASLRDEMGCSHGGAPRVFVSLSAPAKLFAKSGSDAAIHDAARAWGVSTETASAELAAKLPIKAGRETPTESSGTFAGFSTFDTNNPDEGSMPFDFDVDVLPVAYSNPAAGVAGISNELGSANKISAINSAEEKSSEITRSAVVLMESIETDQIPCPRICGAMFSSGVGGFVAFHNGAVKKMWHWWERSDPTRLPPMPDSIGEQPLSDSSGPLYSVDNVGGSAKSQKLSTANCPRTLKDLNDMVKAAKEAQWGEHNDSDHSSTGLPVLGENFFEDDSDMSSDVGEDHYDDGVDMQDASQTKKLGAHGPSNRVVSTAVELLDRSENVMFNQVAGVSSDMLTSVVKITHTFDRVALNNQKKEYAELWMIGDPHMNLKEKNLLNASCHRAVKEELIESDPSQLQESSSIGQTAPATSLQMTHDEERGVHGGEYSVRPNMQESMIFLRKLFTHQQQEAGDVSFRSMLSPPDSPLLKNSKAARKWLPSDELQKDTIEKENHKQIGVYALRSRIPSKFIESDELQEIRDICLHNAGVCKLFGDMGKQGVWELIAKTVASRLSCVSRGYDGWGGPGGGALGVGLISNFLRYYESLGDVQMLSTIVCVLRSRPQTIMFGKRQDWFLLPPDEDVKFDLYIRRYADLLYGWGLLIARAELRKHLVRLNVPTEGGLPPTVDNENIDADGSPGIAFVFQCPQCGGSSDFGTNYCRSCHDFVFRCALCENGIRGLFSVCSDCGHGGHSSHMAEWFESNDKCPTGCGCSCTLSISVTSPKETMMNDE